jgi:choice-of-anchor A domain-containing protein
MTRFLLTTAMLAVALPAGAATLGTAAAYNEFILGNASRQFTDVQGRIAVGGNARYNGFTVATLQPTNQTNLVVGGNLSANSASIIGGVVTGGNYQYSQPTQNGNVNAAGSVTLSGFGTVNGNIRYGTTYSNPNTTVSGSVTQGSTTVPINFASEQTYLQNLSTAQYSAGDPFATNFFNTIRFSLNAGANFYNITQNDFQNSTGFQIVGNIPANAFLVVNVPGATVTMPNVGYFSGLDANRVLLNFYQATTLNASSSRGTIFAPFATVGADSGAYNGQLIALNLQSRSGGFSQIEGHVFDGGGTSGTNTFFTGTLRGSRAPTPTPAPAALSLFGLAAAGLMLRRR